MGGPCAAPGPLTPASSSSTVTPSAALIASIVPRRGSVPLRSTLSQVPAGTPVFRSAAA
jgi:hypothetical protein